MEGEVHGEHTAVPQTLQEVLSALANGGGATPEQIASPIGQALRDLARFPPEWPWDVQAGAIRNVISEVVESLEDARNRETARAQLGLTPQYSSGDPAKRMSVLLGSGALEPEYTYGYSQQIYLALDQMLRQRLSQLNATGDWERYASGYSSPPEEPVSYPFKFERYHMLFTLRKRVGIECTTYRLLRALIDGVDSYRAIAWYYSDPDAEVEVIPIANCRVAYQNPLDDGGAAAMLELPHKLREGETCFFASKVIYHSSRETTRIVSHDVRSQSVDRLTIGIQFDMDSLPSSAWHYTGSREVGTRRPSQGSTEFLPMSEFGFVSHEFHGCENGRRYGIQWDWVRHTDLQLQSFPGRSPRWETLEIPGLGVASKWTQPPSPLSILRYQFNRTIS
jgi:hypothetical protein